MMTPQRASGEAGNIGACRLRCAAVLVVLLIGGCVTSAPLPPGGYSGTWISEGTGHLLHLKHEGGIVSGSWHDVGFEGHKNLKAGPYDRLLTRGLTGSLAGFSRRNMQLTSMHWLPKARVHLFNMYGGVVDNFTILLAMSTTDPHQATGVSLLYNPDDPATWLLPMQLNENFRRVIMGPAKPMLTGLLPTEARLLSGGLMGNLPCDQTGQPTLSVSHTGEVSAHMGQPPAYRVRRILATFQYELQLNDRIPGVLVLVPMDSPRRVVHYRFSSSRELAKPFNFHHLRSHRNGNLCWGWTRSAQIGGQNVRYLLTPYWYNGQSQLAPRAAVAEFYLADPATGALPIARPVVARRGADGAWRPVEGPVYVTGVAPLTAASVVLENGEPASLAFHRVEEPSLQDFLVFNPPKQGTEHMARVARWRTAILVQIKNESLPSYLQKTSSPDLISVITRIETLCLDLVSAAGQAKDRAQRMLETNRGDPSSERELARALIERVEVLKPILVAIKLERVNRDR